GAGPRDRRGTPGSREALMGRDLASMECVPCRGGVPPLDRAEIESYLADLGGEWRVVDNHHPEKGSAVEDFKEALAFTNRGGELAESVGHHPDIYLAWGKVRLTVWTHKIDGLNEAAFVLAARADPAWSDPAGGLAWWGKRRPARGRARAACPTGSRGSTARARSCRSTAGGSPPPGRTGPRRGPGGRSAGRTSPAGVPRPPGR